MVDLCLGSNPGELGILIERFRCFRTNVGKFLSGGFELFRVPEANRGYALNTRKGGSFEHGGQDTFVNAKEHIGLVDQTEDRLVKDAKKPALRLGEQTRGFG